MDKKVLTDALNNISQKSDILEARVSQIKKGIKKIDICSNNLDEITRIGMNASDIIKLSESITKYRDSYIKEVLINY